MRKESLWALSRAETTGAWETLSVGGRRLADAMVWRETLMTDNAFCDDVGLRLIHGLKRFTHRRIASVCCSMSTKVSWGECTCVIIWLASKDWCTAGLAR